MDIYTSTSMQVQMYIYSYNLLDKYLFLVFGKVLIKKKQKKTKQRFLYYVITKIKRIEKLIKTSIYKLFLDNI